MVDAIDTCRDYRATIPLSSLKISKLYDFSSRFYESLNGKNWMCELCTFSQIRSHICMHVVGTCVYMYVCGMCIYVCMYLYGAMHVCICVCVHS